MARLPSASDVPTVTPRSDPGASVPSISVPNVRVPQKTAPSIRVPEGAFDSTLGVAAEELAPGVAALGNAFKQQAKRRAGVDRMKKEKTYGEKLAEELKRINVGADLADDKVLADYGKFTSSLQQELLQEHSKQYGDDESYDILSENLLNVEAEAIGKASATSTKLQYEEADALYNGRLDPLLRSVAQDPTPKNVDRNLLQVGEQIADLKDIFFDPTQERKLIKTARENISLNALKTLILGGRPEEAEFLLDHVRSNLSPVNQRRTSTSIQGIYTSRETSRREALQNTVRTLSTTELARRYPTMPEGSIVEETVDLINGVSKGIDIKYKPNENETEKTLRVASMAGAFQKYYNLEPDRAFELARGWVYGEVKINFNENTGEAVAIDGVKFQAGDPTAITQLNIVRPELPPLKTKPRGTTGAPQPGAATQTTTQPAAETQPTDVVSETTDDQQSSVALENLIQGGGIDASQAAGVMGLLRNITNKVVDAFGGGLPVGRANLATNELIALQLATFGALREEIPGRENVMIDKLLEKATVSPNSPFTGKAGMLNKLKTLKSMVDQELQRIETDVLPLTLTQDMKQKVSINRTILNQQSINLGQVIDAFGKGDAELAKPINQMTLEELNSLDTDRLSDQQVQESETRARALSGVFEEGDTAVDPNTNERIIFKNGKWGTLNQ